MNIKVFTGGDHEVPGPSPRKKVSLLFSNVSEDGKDDVDAVIASLNPFVNSQLEPVLEDLMFGFPNVREQDHEKVMKALCSVFEVQVNLKTLALHLPRNPEAVLARLAHLSGLINLKIGWRVGPSNREEANMVNILSQKCPHLQSFTRWRNAEASNPQEAFHLTPFFSWHLKVFDITGIMSLAVEDLADIGENWRGLERLIVRQCETPLPITALDQLATQLPSLRELGISVDCRNPPEKLDELSRFPNLDTLHLDPREGWLFPADARAQAKLASYLVYAWPKGKKPVTEIWNSIANAAPGTISKLGQNQRYLKSILELMIDGYEGKGVAAGTSEV